jgi:hypothetical protein
MPIGTIFAPRGSFQQSTYRLPASGVATNQGESISPYDYFRGTINGGSMANPRLVILLQSIRPSNFVTYPETNLDSYNGKLMVDSLDSTTARVGDYVFFDSEVYPELYRVLAVSPVVTVDCPYNEFVTATAYYCSAESIENPGAEIVYERNWATEIVRDKVKKIRAVRTRRISTAIRLGYWNPQTATWTVEPAAANDLSAMGEDDATQDDANGVGTKGEFAFKRQKQVDVRDI